MSVIAAGHDAELMLRVKAGDEGSFADLLSRHRDPVVNFLYRMVQNAAIAEELAQDVFLRVYRARASYQPSAKFTTWLYRIATNVALNHIRDGHMAKQMAAIDDPESEVGRELRAQDANVEERLVAQSQDAKAPERIAIGDLKKKLDSGEKLLLMDVREDWELKADGAIAGAIHIPVAELDARMKDIPKDVQLIFY